MSFVLFGLRWCLSETRIIPGRAENSPSEDQSCSPWSIVSSNQRLYTFAYHWWSQPCVRKTCRLVGGMKAGLQTESVQHPAQISGPRLMTHFLSSVTDWNHVKREKKWVRTKVMIKLSQIEHCFLWPSSWVLTPPQVSLVSMCRMSSDTGSLI